VHLGGYPPILPGLMLAAVLSVALTPVAARRLGIAWPHAWLLLISLGVILAVTLTPSREALDHGVVGTVGCDLSRIGPAPFAEYARRDDPILNVAVFFPLGLAIGLMPPSRHRLLVFVAALLLPVAIEVTQAVVVILDRACQGGDVFDNLAGLMLGLAGGLAGRRLWTLVGTLSA
jgi:glycopeptide antibiotics resistance protein